MNKMLSNRTHEESISAESSSGDVTNSTGTDKLGSSNASVFSTGSAQVRRTKICFGVVVLLCGIAVSSTIYYFIVKNDYDRFNVEVRNIDRSAASLNLVSTKSLFLPIVRSLCWERQGLGAMGSYFQLCSHAATECYNYVQCHSIRRFFSQLHRPLL